MHPNPAFRKTAVDRNVSFARSRAFGILSVNSENGPLLSHVPFLLSEDGAEADIHLVRSNPITRLPAGPAVIAVSGPDGYVSPDWYDVVDQVPTWNYVAVHLRGRLEALPPDSMGEMLDRQSAHFEEQLHPKQAWVTDKMSREAYGRMIRQILPYRLRIDAIEGTWKLNQNKSDVARLKAADLVEKGHGHELADLARLMRNPD